MKACYNWRLLFSSKLLPMPTLVHISDLHFGREQADVIEGWFKATQAINPDRVIISGDLTQRATDDEFSAAQAFISRLQWPYFVIPGNHDMPTTDLSERFFNPWKRWQDAINGNTEPVFKADSYALVGVNTARAAGLYFDWSRGQISKKQITEVQHKLQGVPADQLKIVVAHHPFWLPEHSEYRDVVVHRDEAIDAFHFAGVDLILSGHVHVPYTQILNGVLVVHSGTTFSNRLSQNHPNSFNLLQGDHQHLSIDFMDWTGTEFQSAEQRQFQRHERGWMQVAGPTSV
jgi:3',5'-cyclic AMP phosphodiesterase CpdA